MQRPGDQRRRGRGADAAGSATAAKDAAATAFYEMDQAQRYVSGRLTVFADLDARAAERSKTEFATLTESADAAAAAYIGIVDAHDLDEPDRSAAEYDAARRAFVAVTERLTALTADLNAFAGRLSPQLASLEAALDELPAKLMAARDLIAAADRAIADAEAMGMRPVDAADDVAKARSALEVLTSQGLGGLGLAGALSQADEVRRLAEKARESALELPRTAEEVRKSLVAVRTRVQVVAGRVESVTSAMRQLVRRYSRDCWEDLKGASNVIEGALERARERIAEADAHAARQEWKAARQAVTAARTELTSADRRAGAVTGRLADLDATAADPAKAAEKARFAVRDAQKMAVTSPGGPAPEHVRTLDALVARLETGPTLLAGPHPDYWGYLRELDAIKIAAQDVIAQIRDARAHGH
ncbi:molecular chaperone DnaJ [Actinomadura alba]|uniref:Molecular chaperone DnaJ n=1 Tax=Actinomadura alba TaxID=406431 RepID=A0ABR7LGK9_9ACTN|nr:molecular chaperone DnaJ [Actinomadura alba]